LSAGCRTVPGPTSRPHRPGVVRARHARCCGRAVPEMRRNAAGRRPTGQGGGHQAGAAKRRRRQGRSSPYPTAHVLHSDQQERDGAACSAPGTGPTRTAVMSRTGPDGSLSGVGGLKASLVGRRWVPAHETECPPWPLHVRSRLRVAHAHTLNRTRPPTHAHSSVRSSRLKIRIIVVGAKTLVARVALLRVTSLLSVGKEAG